MLDSKGRWNNPSKVSSICSQISSHKGQAGIKLHSQDNLELLVPLPVLFDWECIAQLLVY